MNTPQEKLTVSPRSGKAAASPTCFAGLSVRDQVMGAQRLRPSLRLGRAVDAHPEAGIASLQQQRPRTPATRCQPPLVHHVVGLGSMDL